MAVLSNGMNVESITAMFGSSFPKENRASNPNPIIRIGMWLQSLTEPGHVEFRENYLRDHALKIREAVKMPLAYLGGVQSIEGVNLALVDGFDAVAMGRILIHDPDIVNRWAAGDLARSGCIACNRCVSMMYLPTGTHCVLTGAQPVVVLLHGSRSVCKVRSGSVRAPFGDVRITRGGLSGFAICGEGRAACDQAPISGARAGTGGRRWASARSGGGKRW